MMTCLAEGQLQLPLAALQLRPLTALWLWPLLGATPRRKAAALPRARQARPRQLQVQRVCLDCWLLALQELHLHLFACSASILMHCPESAALTDSGWSCRAIKIVYCNLVQAY